MNALTNIRLEPLEGMFSVCKVKEFPDGILEKMFCFTACTDDEKSIVCRTSDVPDDALSQEDGWRALRVRGVLDFSLVGILGSITGKLMESGISVFAVSTFNTDYLLVKKDDWETVLSLFEEYID